MAKPIKKISTLRGEQAEKFFIPYLCPEADYLIGKVRVFPSPKELNSTPPLFVNHFKSEIDKIEREDGLDYYLARSMMGSICNLYRNHICTDFVFIATNDDDLITKSPQYFGRNIIDLTQTPAKVINSL